MAYKNFRDAVAALDAMLTMPDSPAGESSPEKRTATRALTSFSSAKFDDSFHDLAQLLNAVKIQHGMAKYNEQLKLILDIVPYDYTLKFYDSLYTFQLLSLPASLESIEQITDSRQTGTGNLYLDFVARNPNLDINYDAITDQNAKGFANCIQELMKRLDELERTINALSNQQQTHKPSATEALFDHVSQSDYSQSLRTAIDPFHPKIKYDVSILKRNLPTLKGKVRRLLENEKIRRFFLEEIASAEKQKLVQSLYLSTMLDIRTIREIGKQNFITRIQQIKQTDPLEKLKAILSVGRDIYNEYFKCTLHFEYVAKLLNTEFLPENIEKMLTLPKGSNGDAQFEALANKLRPRSST